MFAMNRNETVSNACKFAFSQGCRRVHSVRHPAHHLVPSSKRKHYAVRELNPRRQRFRTRTSTELSTIGNFATHTHTLCKGS